MWMNSNPLTRYSFVNVQLRNFAVLFPLLTCVLEHFEFWIFYFPWKVVWTIFLQFHKLHVMIFFWMSVEFYTYIYIIILYERLCWHYFLLGIKGIYSTQKLMNLTWKRYRYFSPNTRRSCGVIDTQSTVHDRFIVKKIVIAINAYFSHSSQWNLKNSLDYKTLTTSHTLFSRPNFFHQIRHQV